MMIVASFRRLFLAMSVLATNSFLTMLNSNVTIVGGKQVVAKEKVATTLKELLTSGGGFSRKQASDAIRLAMKQVQEESHTDSSKNPVHELFMGVFYACRVSQLVGINCPADRLPGMGGVVDLGMDDDAVAAADCALVPYAHADSRAAPLADKPHVETIDSEGSDDDTQARATGRFEPSSASASGRQWALWPGQKKRRTSMSNAIVQIHTDVAPDQRRQQLQQSVAQERTQLAQLSVPVLVTKVMQAQATSSKQQQRIQQLQAKVKNLNKKLANAKRRQELSKALQHMNEQEKNAFELDKLGKKKDGRSGRWSLQSKISMGFRCCLSTIAACDFGIVSMVDISKQTVLRAERITGAALIAMMQTFCKEGLGLALSASGSLESLPAHSADESDWSLFGVGFRSDATNTNIWRRKKLHVLEARVMYLSDAERLRSADFDSAMSSRYCVNLELFQARCFRNYFV